MWIESTFPKQEENYAIGMYSTTDENSTFTDLSGKDYHNHKIWCLRSFPSSCSGIIISYLKVGYVFINKIKKKYMYYAY